ncbi:hypothetical protein B0H34DRAFT_700064 [Crassisporium funariophilum]|nr:hypothetical protein B0H34DRAFT_700064 [Crassisporium funariophilum]
MMLMSTPTKLYVHRNTPCDNSMSPKYHHRNCTPPRPYDSPMLTPSPLRQRPLFPLSTSDDDFLQSPYRSPTALAPLFNPFFAPKPQAIDDDEGSIFLSSAASGSFTPFFSTSGSQPLLTPVKQVHRAPSRSVLAIKPMNTIFGSAAPSAELTNTTRVGVGTKRKSTSNATPLRQHNLTPLKVTHAKEAPISPSFDRLAPLPAPKFTARTPQTKAETDAYLKRQTATLIRLQISDNNSGANYLDEANDSGCEMDEDDTGNALFLNKPRLSGKVSQPQKTLVFHPPPAKGKEKEEVAEAISPGGHITKRRARSRPVSAELLEQSFKSPKSPSKVLFSRFLLVNYAHSKSQSAKVTNSRLRHGGAIIFPGTLHRGRASPGSSGSDAGSPRPRRRISGGPNLVRPRADQHIQAYPSRAPLSRIESVSSATLFFGPPIPAPQVSAPAGRSRTNSNLSSSTPAPTFRRPRLRPSLSNRHSYAGPGSFSNDLHAWNTVQTRNVSPSPASSPHKLPDSSLLLQDTDMDDDEDMFFAPEDSSFILNVTRDTPSPKSAPVLPMKYKHRDSLMGSDNEDEMLSTGSSVGGDFLHVMPKASTSVSSICSDEGLVTPGVAPEGHSGWPSAHVYNGGEFEAAYGDHHSYGLSRDEGVDVDDFIIKTLAAASKGQQMLPKKIPGTPVKKVRMSYFGHERPWQSAVASKVGLKDDCDFKKVPRKSLPAAFPPAFPPMRAKLGREHDTESEDEEESPSTRRNNYTGLGLGQPPLPMGRNGASAIPRSRWLMRRSSSGAFSSGSDSASLANTPTRGKGIDWQLPKPRIPLRLSPSSDSINISSRSTSGSSSGSSMATLNSPTNGKQQRQLVAPRASLATRRFSEPFTEEQPGRFERDFDEIEEVGSGEFGKVIKVQSKKAGDVEVYAIKKSKRFEGAKHRLRLREEVNILKHLSQAALSTDNDGYGYGSYGHGHPNVLAYIDSWEEDEALFIRTELCESGNLARFLWEYGRVFPRLDEARVWKIIVDLSNGLRFIHDSGVIHLDLKPSNVFVTKDGRFKIGDFGMASLWPRPKPADVETGGGGGGFEREGDKLYLAPEVLQGRYGKAADMFSFGMTILETASNIVVPDQGEAWHRLRREDFSQVDLDDSPELLDIIQQMMRTDPGLRMSVKEVCEHPVVRRARGVMERRLEEARMSGGSVFAASPLASVPSGFLEEILDRATSVGDEGAMDTSV